jgi:hypothetical protein
MATVNSKDLQPFIESTVQVRIHGREDEDQAPWVRRKISKVTLCPDETHLRIYFDKYFFFAVPLSCSVVLDEQEWSAYDQTVGLYYVIRSEGK